MFHKNDLVTSKKMVLDVHQSIRKEVTEFLAYWRKCVENAGPVTERDRADAGSPHNPGFRKRVVENLTGAVDAATKMPVGKQILVEEANGR